MWWYTSITPNIQEAEAGRFQIPGQPRIYREPWFETSQKKKKKTRAAWGNGSMIKSAGTHTVIAQDRSSAHYTHKKATHNCLLHQFQGNWSV